jgi:AcrR family transcriptional regulator
MNSAPLGTEMLQKVCTVRTVLLLYRPDGILGYVSEPIQKKSSHSREVILEAAANLVHEQGASALTLDATCARAGMSKGGLLYHFRSKEELIQGMMERHLDGILATIEAEMQKDPQMRPGRWHRAAIRSFFNLYRDPDNSVFTSMAAIGQQVMATEGCNTRTYQAIIDRKRECFRHYEESDGISQVEHALMMCTIDGLVMRRIRGESIPDSVLAELEEILLSRTERTEFLSSRSNNNIPTTETA